VIPPLPELGRGFQSMAGSALAHQGANSVQRYELSPGCLSRNRPV